MPSNLLLLPLLAGYWFICTCHILKFRSQQYEGYRLLLHSAALGVLFIGAARFATYELNFLPPLAGFREWWHDFLPIPYAGTAILSVPLGYVAALIGNSFYPVEAAKAKILSDQSTDELAKLLHSAMTRTIPVAITTDSRKFYIGYVVRTPNFSPVERTFALLPMASGYREPTVLSFRFTTDYMKAYQQGPQDPSKEDLDLTIVLPYASIKAANVFNPKTYERVFWPIAEKYIAQEGSKGDIRVRVPRKPSPDEPPVA